MSKHSQTIIRFCMVLLAFLSTILFMSGRWLVQIVCIFFLSIAFGKENAYRVGLNAIIIIFISEISPRVVNLFTVVNN